VSRSIVTKHGDRGETGLLYGGRVPKDDPHTEAYGSIDETVSALGLARSLEEDPARAERLMELQRQLFTVGAELATGRGEHARLEQHFATVTAADVDALEAETLALEERFPVTSFVIPGATPAAAAIDLARTMLRRAERRAVSLSRAGELENSEVLRYLNRCSDLLFMLAREAEQGGTVAK
jgi:cob(I)alamin adenosyltransferase